MLLPLYIIIPSTLIVITSVPVYLVLLTAIWKYRQKSPFNSPFFTMSFHLGLFDMFHLFHRWVIGMLLYLYPHSLVVTHANAFGKQYSMLWWYTALGRKLGVFLLAVDRLAIMWFNKKLTKMQVQLLLIFNWLFPVVLTAPQAFTEFNFYVFNESDGVLLYWVDHHYKKIYLHCCAVFCATASAVCAISYGLAFYKLYKQRGRRNSRARVARQKTDAKLALVGFIQVFITLMCSAFCGTSASIIGKEGLIILAGIEQILFDIYSCLSPFLLLICCKVAKIHFKAVFFCRSPEQYIFNKTTEMSSVVRRTSR